MAKIKLNKLATICYKIAFRRFKKGQVKKPDMMNFLKHCSTEVNEAVEAGTVWLDNCHTCSGEQLEKNKHNFALELADIIICVLSLSAYENIDIEKALIESIKKNIERIK